MAARPSSMVVAGVSSRGRIAFTYSSAERVNTIPLPTKSSRPSQPDGVVTTALPYASPSSVLIFRPVPASMGLIAKRILAYSDPGDSHGDQETCPGPAAMSNGPDLVKEPEHAPDIDGNVGSQVAQACCCFGAEGEGLRINNVTCQVDLPSTSGDPGEVAVAGFIFLDGKDGICTIQS